MDQYIGKMLDNRYEILERIGIGGMAVVYKSRDHRLNRLVAVKILKPELANDAEFRRRFHDESQAVAMLSHVNIVSVYDVSHSDGLDYIVMELIDGMTLKQYMQKRGTPLNWREAIHFITQILRALGHAHGRGIVHRDIKPQNILVLRDGSIKVADFGIARLTSAAQATLTQEALGSVHYISPEQAKGSQVDGRSDLYSAGVVLYEMLTGRLPFEGETPVFVAIQHINSIPISPRELNPEIPPMLEAITMKAMAPDPDQRYASAEEMLADLREFRKNPDAACSDRTDGMQEDEEEVEEPTVVVSLSDLTSGEKSVGKEPEPRPRHREQQETRIEQPERRRRVREPEQEEMEEPRRKRRGVPVGLIAVVVILLFVGGIIYFAYTLFSQEAHNQPQGLSVPSLLGYTMEELQADPTIQGEFTVEIGATMFSEYPEGEICDQTPAAGEMIRGGNKVITVTISGGEEGIYMPEVEGQLATTVIDQLQNMGLYVRQERENSTISEGYVIDCTPEPNTKLNRGDTVTIVISDGPEEEPPVTVPRFVGLDIEQVRDQMNSLGLTVGTVSPFYNDEYPKDTVIWQSVDLGTQVEKGTVINFQISDGPAPEPSVEPTEEPSDPIVIPTQDVNVPVGTKEVTVNLSDYSGMVSVRILVGGRQIFDNMVDCSEVQYISRHVTGSGTQTVSIYINNSLVESYPITFN